MISAIQNFLERFPDKFGSFLPEVIIALGLSLLLFLSLFRLKRTILIGLYLATLLGAMGASWGLPEAAVFIPFRNLVCACALASVVFFYNSPLFQSKYTAESLFLLLASSLGLNMMMLSEDLLSLFVALELSAIASYILVILSWQKNSLEGAMKYLLFGVFASAVMLYGISWIYGLSGNTYLATTTWKVPVSLIHYFAIFMTLAGLLMKISAVPYHIWTPDAYQIAPTPVVAFLATASKIAGIVAILKVVNAYAPILPNITQIVALISIISIILGNLIAFWQKNLKRMLAYSSVANAGYLLIGAVNPSYQDILFFFLLVYSIANVLIFAIAEYYEQNYQFTNLEHFAGIGKTSPLMSISLLIGFVSLAGLPPTAGFTAKLLIFSMLWGNFETSKQVTFVIWLLIGLLNTIIALFYYLKMPYFAFFRNTEQTHSTKHQNYYFLASIILLAALLIILFIKPFG